MRLKVLRSKIPKFVFSRGFTLIEFIVVLSIIAILSTLGIVAFVNYSRIQALNAAASDVVTMLQTAKSRAQSQVKPALCITPPLVGYTVVIPSTRIYRLEVICGEARNVSPIDEKTLPANINFSFSSLGSSFLFNILTGGVEGALPAPVGTSITIGGYNGQTKIITIYSDGRIVAQ